MPKELLAVVSAVILLIHENPNKSEVVPGGRIELPTKGL